GRHASSASNINTVSPRMRLTIPCAFLPGWVFGISTHQGCQACSTDCAPAASSSRRDLFPAARRVAVVPVRSVPVLPVARKAAPAAAAVVLHFPAAADFGSAVRLAAALPDLTAAGRRIAAA